MTAVQGLCEASYDVRDALGVLEAELGCHLAEDHAASPFPKWLHWDKERDLVWWQVAQLP